MAAYLTEHPPVRDQWYEKRNRPLTGCTVLHTAESIMDSAGPDTGAEAVAEFIRTRTTPGSYHDLCDSDSAINLVDYRHAAYHDGTGSNNWALSISYACSTTDWRAMSPARRRAFLRQGAIAFARQQAYRRSIGAPLTELRLITKAQSDAGMSGFIYHGWRDPGRRTDPGVVSPDLFPFDEWIDACRAAMSGTDSQPKPEEYQDMKVIQAPNRGAALIGAGYYRQLVDEKEDFASAVALWGGPKVGNERQFDVWVAQAVNGNGVSGTTAALAGLAAQVAGIAVADVDEDALATLLAPKLSGVTQQQVAEAVREVLRTGTGS